MKIQKILVPTDFSADAEHAANTAAELAAELGAEVLLLHAYRVDLPLATPSMGGGFVLPPNFYEELRVQATGHVEERANAIAKKGVKATGIAVEERPVVAIIEEAKSLGADMIVMGTRGLTGVKHLAFGSVAERVVREAPCPVLTVKSND